MSSRTSTRRLPRALIADVAKSYQAEIAQAAQLRIHAERARYPQMARELRRLADVEERHAGWLRDHLASHGTPVPVVGTPRVVGRNPWQRAVAAYHAAVAKRRRLIEQIYRWDPDERKTVTVLRRIEREDKLALASYQALSMRSDPLAAH